MLGALAGDIIASPYEWVDTTDFYFNLLDSTRGYYRGRSVAYHPKVTDAGVMTAAVARWLMYDTSRSADGLRQQMIDFAGRYPDCGFAPYMRRWIESRDHLPMNSFGNGAAVRISPVGMLPLSLPEVLDIARTCAMVTHRNPDAITGAEALAQAVWMASHGRSKDDIAFAMKNDFGLRVDRSMEDMRALLSGAVPEPVVVNGEVIGEVLVDTGKIDSSSGTTISAALAAFLTSEDVESAARRAVTLGGDVTAVTSMACAVAAPFYGGVPEKLERLCSKYVGREMLDVFSLFERRRENVSLTQSKTRNGPKKDTSFMVIHRAGMPSVYVVPPYRNDIKDAIISLKGYVDFISPKELPKILDAMTDKRQGTYIEQPRPYVRTLYIEDGRIVSSPAEDISSGQRRDAVAELQKIKDFASDVKSRLQRAVGYYGNGSIHFSAAYYPVIYPERVEIRKGDLLEGAVEIAQRTGLLKLVRDGDDYYGVGKEADCYRKRAFGDGCRPCYEDITAAIAEFCLDEGAGVRLYDERAVHSDHGNGYRYDTRTNLEKAFDDIAHSDDEALLEAIESSEKKTKTAGYKFRQ